jgi:hypothetical protein
MRQYRDGGIMRKLGVAAAGIGVLAAATLAASPASASGYGGTQHFLVVNTSTADNATAPVSAIGPIHALGKDIPLTSSKDRFAFPKGSIIVVHKATKETQSSDPASCSASFTQQGNFKVISGTGAYAHVHASGTFSVTGYFIGCGNTTIAASVIIKATGTLSY